MKKKRREFLKHTCMAGIGLASASFFQANAFGRYNDKHKPDTLPVDYDGVTPDSGLFIADQSFTGRKVFVAAGKPVAVTGSATKDMYQKGNELIVRPDKRWGNPLFADSALMEKDFHIHARLTLDKLAGTGASFLIGGHYHYPRSRPEGNRTFRVLLDDDLEVYNRSELETGSRIVHGITEQRAPWFYAEKEIVGKSCNYINSGEPFNLDIFQKGESFIFQINGQKVFKTSLRGEGRISGHGDSGWPVSFGFFPDKGVIRLHDFWAEGSFSRMLLDHQDVWSMGHDGYFTYRIPSLCVTPGGTVLAFAEARRSDWVRWDWRSPNADEVHCVMKRSIDGGKTWSGQKIISGRGSSYEARNPSPIVDKETGDVFIITIGPYIIKTRNNGESWSEPRSLRGLLDENMIELIPGPCTGIQLCKGAYKGRLIIPVNVRTQVEDGVENKGNGVIYSDDHGENWELSELTAPGPDEPTVIELEDGRVLMNSRNNQRISGKSGRLISVSYDGGTRFEEFYGDEQLDSHGCGASLIRYDWPRDSTAGTKKPILFAGPGEPRSRRNMTVKLSYDECKSWPVSSPVIYSGHSGYAAMAVLPDGQVGVLYEKDAYRRLSFVKLPLDWITS